MQMQMIQGFSIRAYLLQGEKHETHVPTIVYPIVGIDNANQKLGKIFSIARTIVNHNAETTFANTEAVKIFPVVR